MSRLACLLVPLFPLAARLRAEPELKGECVAIFEGNGNAARVVAASRIARRAGVEPGMTLPQARALVGKLVARARDRECERAAQEALLEIADSFSPRVEDAGDGIVYLDLDGLPSLTDHQPPITDHQSPPPVIPSREASSSVILMSEAPSPVILSREPPPPVIPRSAAPSPVIPRSEAPSSVILRSEATKDLLSSSSPNHQSPNHASSPPTHNSQLTIRDFSLGAEKHLGREILATLDKASLPARAGLASSKLAARVAAGLPDTPTVVPPGEEAAFLAPLSLDRLSPELEIAATLARWGVRSIGDLARLPEREIAARLGEAGRELYATARGRDPRPLEPRLPPPVLSEGMDLEWPLVNLEPFLFLGNAALERLAARLDSQGLACTRLELALKLDPDGHDARAIALPAPTRDVRTLLTLVRLELEARRPGAPVSGFTFVAHPDKPRRAQLTLFGPPALSPDRLATTIARLAAMLGADRVGSPRAADGYRPERYAQVSYAPPPPPDAPPPPRVGRGLLAVRVLRPPLELEVIIDEPGLSPSPVIVSREVPAPVILSREAPPPVILRSEATKDLLSSSSSNHHSPITNYQSRPPILNSRLSTLNSSLPRLRAIKTLSPDASPPINGTVKVASGPWSLEESWWSDTPADRDYWDVELSDGALYRIYRDRNSGSWFADGVYD